MSKKRYLSYYLSNYFRLYLPGERGYSKETISSYRDTFKQFLLFCRAETGKEPEMLCVSDMQRQLVINYLDDLEAKGRSVSTRNQRLAALKSFANYLKYECPDNLYSLSGILEIQMKKAKENVVNYLPVDGIALILSKPNLHTKKGLRDAMILTMLYDAAARVSEITDIKVGDIRLESPATIILHGKGSKDRIVPLSENTASLVRSYILSFKLNEIHNKDKYLFQNRNGQQFTRAGIAYILKKYVDIARTETPDIIPDKFSPHCMRHSKAMHLLQAGVAIIYIRDFLGHCSINTTEVYARSDEKMKREALEKAYNNAIVPNSKEIELWNDDETLMDFLTGLCKR